MAQTMSSQAVVPYFIQSRESGWVGAAAAVVTGVLLISLLAQVAIPLPFTPVPITGQTFAVALVALLWGRRLGGATVLSYLGLGAAGLPIFAQGKAGIAMVPTMGYLFGMVAAAWVMGTLSDLGWVRRGFLWAWLSAFIGSTIVFSFGVLVLSRFIPADQLFIAGVLPFLPGDMIKTSAAAAIAASAQRVVKR